MRSSKLESPLSLLAASFLMQNTYRNIKRAVKKTLKMLLACAKKKNKANKHRDSNSHRLAAVLDLKKKKKALLRAD